MIGPPGSGKSMLAAAPARRSCRRSSPREILEVSMIHSVAGRLRERRAHRPRGRSAPRIIRPRMAGAGRRRHAAPGPARSRSPITACCSSTSCRSSSRQALDALRQPLETGEVGDCPRQRPRHLSGARPARRGHESVPVRPCRASPAIACGRRAALRRRLPGAHLGPAARPHRSRHRGAGRHRPPISSCRRPPKARAEVARAGRRRRAPRRAPATRRWASDEGARTNAERRRRRSSKRSRTPDAGGPHAARAKRPSDAPVGARLHRVLRVARTLADLDGEAGVAAHPHRRGARLSVALGSAQRLTEPSRGLLKVKIKHKLRLTHELLVTPQAIKVKRNHFATCLNYSLRQRLRDGVISRPR